MPIFDAPRSTMDLDTIHARGEYHLRLTSHHDIKQMRTSLPSSMIRRLSCTTICSTHVSTFTRAFTWSTDAVAPRKTPVILVQQLQQLLRASVGSRTQWQRLFAGPLNRLVR